MGGVVKKINGVHLQAHTEFCMGKRSSRGIAIAWCAIPVVLTSAAIMVLASVPPVSRDALTHHLAVPKLYLKHGAMVELPYLKCSYYPQLLDLLYCIPVYLGKDIVAKYIHFCFALGTAWLVCRYLQRKLSLAWGCLGGIFFLTIPVIVKLGITVYVDLGLIFFSTASMLSLLGWRDKGCGWPGLLPAAAFAGLAASVKYNGLIVIMLLTFSIPFIVKRSEKVKAQGALHMVAFFLVAMAVFSPWMIRNYRWTGNPLYPLYSRVFEHQKDIGQDSAGMSHIAARKYVYHEKLWQTLTIPVRIFFEGKDDDPKFFDGVLSPFLFFLPFAAFFGVPADRRRDLAFFAWFAVLYILMVFLKIDMRIRYVGPSIPPLVILSVFGLHNLANGVLPRAFKSRRIAGVAAVLVAVAMFLYNYRYVAREFDVVKPFAYLSGSVSRDDYIAAYVKEYPLVRYVNEHTATNARVLAVFLGERLYYFDRDVRFAKDLFPPGAPDSPGTPEELWNMLRHEGYTHIIVRYDLFNNRVALLFNHDQKVVIAGFFKKFTRLLKRSQGFGLYAIKAREVG